MKVIATAIRDTAQFLSSKGIRPEIAAGRKASPRAVERFQEKFLLTLPPDFAAFYTEFANGYSFFWEGPLFCCEESNEEFGCFAVPKLADLARGLRSWQQFVLFYADNPEEVKECVGEACFEKAMAIWQRMKCWIPFWDEGNGDHFCIDTQNGYVVYDQHDWYDGFGSLANTNGIIAGKTFSEFVVNWSQFCFRRNRSLWWGEFEKFGAIQWLPQFFNESYCRTFGRGLGRRH